MVVSGYDKDDNGNENRICFWLRLDNWHLCEAAMLFIDIDPDTVEKPENNFYSLKTLTGLDYTLDDFDSPSWDEELAICQKKYNDMHRILFHPDMEYDTPTNWLNRAIIKRVDIPWLNFAIQNGFYKRENNCTDNLKIEKTLSQRTENNYLRIIYSLMTTIKGFEPTRPYEAAQLIINEIGFEDISKETLAKYISKAHELESKNRD